MFVHILTYSASYLGDFWLSASGLDVCWGDIRSTVEMQTGDLPNPIELPLTFEKDFWDLEETAPYAPTADVVRTIVLPFEGPMNTCERVIG